MGTVFPLFPLSTSCREVQARSRAPQNNSLTLKRFYRARSAGLGRGVGRGLGVGPTRGVGVGLGVE